MLYPNGYSQVVITFLRTEVFDRWLRKLKNPVGKARILRRLRAAELGNFGDCEPVGHGISEMRIHTGPGYRVYFTRKESGHVPALGRWRQIHAEARHRAGKKSFAGDRRTVMTTLSKFDAADYLDNEEVIAAYISEALEDPNPDVFLAAVADVAKARGMSRLARDAGLGRESLYKALTPGARPRYDTVLKVLHALGVKLQVNAGAGQA